MLTSSWPHWEENLAAKSASMLVVVAFPPTLYGNRINVYTGEVLSKNVSVILRF